MSSTTVHTIGIATTRIVALALCVALVIAAIHFPADFRNGITNSFHGKPERMSVEARDAAAPVSFPQQSSMWANSSQNLGWSPYKDMKGKLFVVRLKIWGAIFYSFIFAYYVLLHFL